jgi:hypothetical protein
MKCFLSHSSKDKARYVDSVAKQLVADIGEDSIIYDGYSFELGMQSIEEIFTGLEESALFVIFLSSSSLESNWVKKEIKEAKERLSSSKIKRIYPILIDKSITHEDPRIPQWMREESYNLRYVSKPALAVAAILRRRKQIIDNRFPEKRDGRGCIGRNQLIEEFESRIYDFDKDHPQCIIISGADEIGRRTLLNACLLKTSLIREYYEFPTIGLNSEQSIEDFILKLDELGLSEERNLSGLMKMKMEDKVALATSIANDIQAAREKILIIDEECIISFNADTEKGNIADWFIQIIKNLEHKKQIVFAIVSNRKLKLKNYQRDQLKIYSIHVPELSPEDKKKLLQNLTASARGIQLSRDDFTFFLDILDGYPGQIHYAVQLIHENGVNNVKRKSDILEDIRDYSSKRVQKILARYENDEEKMALLHLLSEIGFSSYELLYKIVGKSDEVNKNIDEFLNSSICEEEGIDHEFIRVTGAVREYIRRNKFGTKLREDYEQNLVRHVDEFIDALSSDSVERKDVSDYLYSLQRAVSDGKVFSGNIRNYLLPSHFLQSIKQQYSRRRDQTVISLSDRVLEEQVSLDPSIVHTVRYYLCSSLARLNNERFWEEIKHIEGIDKAFLRGFFYRKQGKPEDAIPHFKEVLHQGNLYSVSRAARELVEVYRDLEKYEDALALARENYEKGGRTNPHHIQAYFTCLVDSEKNEENKKLLKQLLKDLNSITSGLAKEMHGNAEAQYIAFWENNRAEALYKIHKVIDIFPDSIYPQLTKFEICFKFNDEDGMRESITALEGQRNHKSIERAKCLFDAKKGNLSEAIKRLHKEFRKYPSAYKKSFQDRLEQITPLF